MKPSAQHYSITKQGCPIDKRHSFLGSYAGFDEHNHMYVPIPRFGKICASFTQKYKNNDKVERFIRYLVLTLNCVPDEEHYNHAIHYLTWFYNHPLNRSSVYLFDEVLNECEITMNVKDTFQVYTWDLNKLDIMDFLFFIHSVTK